MYFLFYFHQFDQNALFLQDACRLEQRRIDNLRVLPGDYCSRKEYI